MKFKAKSALIIGSEVLTPGQEYDSKELKVADKYVKSWIESGLVEEVDENESKNNDDAGGDETVSSGGKRSGRRSDSKSEEDGE
ncbi:hypothetical protein [Anoxybacillus sp. FSL W8-1294]|uniref:hypothetical protein n=1 Tax=Anoxybacillus sp. FSL W8-1294 TaxID=2954655 RepID=UPI0030CACE19